MARSGCTSKARSSEYTPRRPGASSFGAGTGGAESSPPPRSSGETRSRIWCPREQASWNRHDPHTSPSATAHDNPRIRRSQRVRRRSLQGTWSESGQRNRVLFRVGRIYSDACADGRSRDYQRGVLALVRAGFEGERRETLVVGAVRYLLGGHLFRRASVFSYARIREMTGRVRTGEFDRAGECV